MVAKVKKIDYAILNVDNTDDPETLKYSGTANIEGGEVIRLSLFERTGGGLTSNSFDIGTLANLQTLIQFLQDFEAEIGKL